MKWREVKERKTENLNFPVSSPTLFLQNFQSIESTLTLNNSYLFRLIVPCLMIFSIFINYDNISYYLPEALFWISLMFLRWSFVNKHEFKKREIPAGLIWIDTFNVLQFHINDQKRYDYFSSVLFMQITNINSHYSIQYYVCCLTSLHVCSNKKLHTNQWTMWVIEIIT
jgi:hypothetical protein